MPNTPSARKAQRVSERKAVVNKVRKNKLKRSLKEFRKSLDSSLQDAQSALSKVFSDLDKAAKKNTIKKQNANRRKSRLTAVLKNTFEQHEGSAKNKDSVATKEKKKAPAKKTTAKSSASKSDNKTKTPTAKKAPAKKTTAANKKSE